MQMLKPCAWCIGAFMIPNTSKKCVAVLGKTSVQAHVNASFFVSFCLNTLVYSFVRKRHMEKAREGEETQGRNEGFQALRGRGRRLPIGSAWWFIRWGWHSTSEEEVSPTQEAPLRHPVCVPLPPPPHSLVVASGLLFFLYGLFAL